MRAHQQRSEALCEAGQCGGQALTALISCAQLQAPACRYRPRMPSPEAPLQRVLPEGRLAPRHCHRDKIVVLDTGISVVPDVVVRTASPDVVAMPDGQYRCSHCQQPVATNNVVSPARAAVVRVPEVTLMLQR